MMDVQGTITPLLGALARGIAAGAQAAARRGAADAAASLARLAHDRPPASCEALAADGRVVPALAVAICSRHADGAVVEAAMVAAANLLAGCPAAAKAEQQASLLRLGALEAAVQRVSAGGRVGRAAAFLVGALAEGPSEAVARAAVAAGALPRLLALTGDADDAAAGEAVRALGYLIGRTRARWPIVAAAVDAGAVRAFSQLLRAGMSDGLIGAVLRLMAAMAKTPAGAERLVADDVRPHVVRLLRSPAVGVADAAVGCLAAAVDSPSSGALAVALAADATAAPAVAALLRRQDGTAPFDAACVLFMTLTGVLASGGPEASRRAADIAVAVRRAGGVPRLVELLRAPLEGEQRRPSAANAMGALAFVCRLDAAAAREAFGAGAWSEACRFVVEQGPCGDHADTAQLEVGLTLLAQLAPHLRNAAPRPAAACEPGLVTALAQVLGRAAPRLQLGTVGPSGNDALAAGHTATVLEAALEGADGAQRAAEFVHAGGAAHLVRAGSVGATGLLRKGPRPHRPVGMRAHTHTLLAAATGCPTSQALPNAALSEPPINGSCWAARADVHTHAAAPTLPQLALLPAMRGDDDISYQITGRTAYAAKALAQHACGRAALLAAGADADGRGRVAAESRQGAVAAALGEALEVLRRPPEHGPGPLAAGPAPRLCAACGARGSRARPLMRCTGCRGPERWCSAECQRISWPGHRAVCLERRAAASTAAAPAGSQQAV
jgi:hypothetical protein